MSLDHLSITVTHWYADNRRTRLFGNNKLCITSGLEPSDVAKARKANISDINNRTVAISKPDAAAVVDLDGVKKRNVTVGVNALWRNDDAFAILVQNKPLVGGCQHPFTINQERTIAGKANATIILDWR